MSKNFKATLVRGETYYLGADKRFERGKPQIVTASEKAHLDANAVDRGTVVTNDVKEIIVQPKFKFEAYNGPIVEKGDKAKELLAMQTKGDVDFEDDADEGAADTEDTSDEDATEGEAEAPKAETSRSRSRRK